MKLGILRPQALRDQQERSRKYHKEAGSKVAVRFPRATNVVLDPIELEPGIGSPVLGKILNILDLGTWLVSRFPLLWFYFRRDQHLDVVRLLGERQDIADILAGDG